ncbi:hypothetical protein KCP74_07785 [Salmonella enterica subsp. enterica]|nr:hypothetical protein KCP74_07785 [Salmonella enterica subsp. enterica]
MAEAVSGRSEQGVAITVSATTLFPAEAAMKDGAESQRTCRNAEKPLYEAIGFVAKP